MLRRPLLASLLGYKTVFFWLFSLFLLDIFTEIDHSIGPAKCLITLVRMMACLLLLLLCHGDWGQPYAGIYHEKSSMALMAANHC